MGVDHKIVRHTGQFKGLDKRSSDIDRTIDYSTDMNNAMYRSSGAIIKRKGFHYAASNDDCSYGMINYKKVNTINGNTEDTLLMVNKNLNVLKSLDLSITRPDTSLLATVLDMSATDYTSSRSILFVNDMTSAFGTDANPFYLSIPTTQPSLENNTVVFLNSENTFLRIKSSTQVLIPDPSNSLAQITVRRYALVGESATLSASINNTGSHTGHTLSTKNGNIKISLFADGQNRFKFEILDLTTDTLLVDKSLEDGETSNSLTVYELNVEINSKFGISSTYTGDVSTSPAAALLDITKYTLSAGNSFSLKSRYWESVPRGDHSTSTVTFPNYDKTVSTRLTNKDYLENASFAEMNNLVYISNGFDPVMKYDGTQVYRAGLPCPGVTYASDGFSISSGFGTSGTNFSATKTQSQTSPSTPTTHKYIYGVRYSFTDAIGNTITSRLNYLEAPVLTTDSTTGIDSNDFFDIKVPRLTDTDFCLKSKNNAGTTIPNPNLKIEIFRTLSNQGLGSAFFKILTVQNEDQTASGASGAPANTNDNFFVHRDNQTDDAIGTNEVYVIPENKTHDLPPFGKYLSVFKNCLVITGQPTNVNALNYSIGPLVLGEIGSEYFPDADNQAIVESPIDTAITATAPLRDLLYIFHSNSIHVLAGDISDPNGIPFTVDLLSRESGIGCVSNSSIVEFANMLMFLSDDGLYTIDASTAINEISAIIRPLFKEKTFSFKRAVAKTWADKQLIVVNLPAELTGTDIYTDVSDSLTLVYDYFRGAWLKWNTIDASGGIDTFGNTLFYSTREATKSRLVSFNSSSTEYDYADHINKIDFKYETNWESLGEPTVPKKYLRLKIYSFDNDESFESPKFNLVASLQKNYFESDLGSITFNFGGGAFGWSNAEWGGFPWGDATQARLKSKLPTGKAACLKIKFLNDNINENILLTKYELEIAAPYRREVKE